MNRILKLSAIALLASSTSLMAQSKSFEGVSFGLTASVVGAELSGSSAVNSTNVGGTSNSTGTLGKVTEILALDLSYGFAAGPNGIISIGASYTPGKAKFGTGAFTDTNTGGTSDTTSVNGNIKDPYTIYIAPTYVVSKDSALYAKVGYSHADINVGSSGTYTVTSYTNKLDGWTYAVGSKTMLTSNSYIGIEASYTDYDNITATLSNGNTATASPKVAQGSVTIGYKF